MGERTAAMNLFLSEPSKRRGIWVCVERNCSSLIVLKIIMSPALDTELLCEAPLV